MYNLPTEGEVAVVVSDNSGSNGRNVLVHARGGGYQNISETSPYYDPLRYPLLFPRGDLGWHLNLLHTDANWYHFFPMI